MPSGAHLVCPGSGEQRMACIIIIILEALQQQGHIKGGFWWQGAPGPQVPSPGLNKEVSIWYAVS